MSSWNFADVWEAVAAAQPDAPAVSQGERRWTWRDFERRAAFGAAALVGLGAGHQDKVAQYLYNCPEYLESVFACFKASLVPVNTNYRYADDELVYLWDNADVAVVTFHASFAPRIERIRARIPRVKAWLCVEDGTVECPSWAVPYESALGNVTSSVSPRRSGDDLYLLYTGGTTGMPKGVMWRQDDLFASLNRTAEVRYPEDGSVADVHAQLQQPAHPPARLVPAPPLMHGSGSFTTFSVLDSGGSIVLLTERSFSPTELLDTIERERITEITIVGDAFAKPILDALDREPQRWDISSLWLIISSGVMWAEETKTGLLRHNPRLLCVDTLGSSEAIGLASSRSSRKSTAPTAGFRLSETTRVLTDDGREVAPGSGEVGLVATRGRTPLGYYKDEAKTAATFRVIDGVRWSVPGDWATVEADGTVRLLGRGSVCINTGGEKVFPEEVEEALKTHPFVFDAVVVGVPDERFGEVIVGVVQGRAAADVDPAELIRHVKDRLAGYKAPKHVVVVESIGRDTNGKVDYRRHREEAAAALSR